MRRALGLLVSPRFAVLLIVALAVASAAGSLAPHAGLLRSPAYAGLWALLCASILACSARRWRFTRDQIVASLAHLGLVAIAAGFAWNAIEGETGGLLLSLASETTAFTDMNGESHSLPFAVRLDRIDEEHDETSHDILLVAPASNGKVIEVDLTSRGTAPIGDAGRSIAVLVATERFSEEPSVPEQVRRDLGLDGPAVLVEMSTPGGAPDRRWLFADHPEVDLNLRVDPDVSLAYQRRYDVSQAWAHLSVHEEGRPAQPARVGFNAPLRVAGFQLCLLDYDARRRVWATFHVKKDPGAPAILLGLVATCVGILYVLLARGLLRASAVRGASSAETTSSGPQPGLAPGEAWTCRTSR